LSRAAFDDDELIGIIDGIDSIKELSSSQRQQIRFDCLYLRKAYEVTVQNMNKFTWKDCIIIAIDEMKDVGFNHIKNEKKHPSYKSTISACQFIFCTVCA
jgi:hypothetical protein